ncbi:hypothetical protein [Methylibium sp.]|uniref:hypothetical protein n=1 Tax=Methylibium sp. TaxID=2067992 RepID=UPI0017D989B4|nr:hypothetical protein [Methylibium sp.]MBA3589960.1 hypothetical protein [Methylibium sp.]
MGRSAASIQAEITTLETHLQSGDSLVSGVASRGTSLTRAARAGMEARLDSLYQQLGRADGTDPMFPRGVITGLRT